MSFTAYDITIPVFLRAFANLSAILEKGRAHAEARGLDPWGLVEARLIETMDPLRAQVQRASDTAKACTARLTGIKAPSFPDEEASFAELQQRIEKTVAFLKTVPPEAFAEAETRRVTLRSRAGEADLDGSTYLLGHALPNFFFHVTTAYDILRHKGVEIGKADYIGKL